MNDESSESENMQGPLDWLVVPPTGVAGCPLEDWLGALTQAGEIVTAQRDPEGLWIRFGELDLAGFVSLDKSMVEAINFEIPAEVANRHRIGIKKAAESLGWEIWDQNDDDDEDWFGDDDEDE
jgi:hypothetical protein